MITVHHLENSRSQRILWLLEELGADYEVRRYQRDPETSLAPPELKKLHPLGKAPVVTVDDQTLAESGAIIEYLVDRFDNGSLRPAADSPELQTYRYWLHYAEGTLAPLMVLSLIVNRIETAPVPFFLKPVVKGIGKKVRAGYLDATIKANVEFLESSLVGKTWFCGAHLSAADIQMSFALEALEARVGTDDAPNIAAVLGRMRERPAYQRALDKGGPYGLLTLRND
ncbi:MAG: glutathione S-transferase [Woeseiaceae bacterium]|nr:glutathione S-transferase [Woeseiaceae bacterium]